MEMAGKVTIGKKGEIKVSKAKDGRVLVKR